MKAFIEETISSAEWRVRELELLKKIGLITLANESQHTKDQFYRMCIPYIYAHWEGFVIETFKQLARYINELELQKSSICTQLYTFSLQDVLKPLSGKQKFEQCCEFTKKFVEQFPSPLYLDPKLVSAKSNLTYRQVNEIFTKFGIECPISRYASVINQLVNQRNQIAHGESGIIVDYDNISEKIRILQEIFDEIIMCIYKYLLDEEYLKIV